MKKVQVLDIKGSKKNEINTILFEAPIREDIIQKIVEVEKLDDKQLYAPYEWAGMQTSASGNVKHNRHVWKTDRGRGMSRYPKKRMSDKGSHFVWTAAVIPGVRGGRRAHPPKLIRRDLKINKKEKIFGMLSALTMVASPNLVIKKYSSLDNNLKINLPFIAEDKILTLKTKEFYDCLKNILGESLYSVALQEKSVRPGRGKMRNRRYKKNAGMMLVIADKQNIKIKGIDVIKVEKLRIKDIVSNGARVVIFTEEAIKDLESKLGNREKNPEIKQKLIKK